MLEGGCLSRLLGSRGGRVTPPALGTALMPMLALRFAGHLPYFKFGSGLMLPHGLSLAGAAVTALAYSVLCLGVARWVTRRQVALALFHRPVSNALLGTMVVVAAMMILGPVISLLMPGDLQSASLEAEGTVHSWSVLLMAYLGLLVPVSGGYFAAQFIVRRRLRRAG